MSCIYVGCQVSLFIPGILLVGLWLAACLMVPVLVGWAVLSRHVIWALFAAALALVLYSTS